jgi:hypothetical protein
VLIVKNDPELVEADLAAGRLTCPGCGVGVLSRWGFARRRTLRDGQELRPRRGLCQAVGGAPRAMCCCPIPACLRRRDAVQVIGAALSAMVDDRQNYEVVAERLRVPAETVRGWLKRFRRLARAIAAHFGRWLLALLPGRPPPEQVGSATAVSLELIGATARAASLRLETRPAWSWASALTAGALLSHTNSPWPSPE